MDSVLKIVVNLIPVIVAALKEVPGAIDLLSKLGDKLKDGASPEELKAASLELETELAKLIADTDV